MKSKYGIPLGRDGTNGTALSFRIAITQDGFWQSRSNEASGQAH